MINRGELPEMELILNMPWELRVGLPQHRILSLKLDTWQPVNRALLVAQMAKNLPEMWETWMRSLGWEDSLEKGMAPHSSILKNSMNRGAWWATVHGTTKSWT